MKFRTAAVAMALVAALSLASRVRADEAAPAAPARADEAAKCGPLDALTATPPQLDGASTKPVLLRYSFKPGQAFDYAVEMATNVRVDSGGQKISTPELMKMNFTYSVDSVAPEGAARLNTVFTRMAMSVDALGTTVKYDSDEDKSPSNDAFKGLSAMINQKIFWTIAPRGEVTDIDMREMKESLERAGATGMFQTMEQTLNETFRSDFVHLPENPVSVGDLFDADKKTQKMEAIGSLTMTVQYAVLGVSADQRRVLLKPLAKFDLEAAPDTSAQLDSSSVEGWLLFDRVRGKVDRAYCVTKMGMSFMQSGQKANMTMDSTTKLLCSCHEATAASQEPAPQAPAPSKGAE
jgi:hypothetical protein